MSLNPLPASANVSPINTDLDIYRCLPDPLKNLITQYAIETFGKIEWQTHFKIEIKEEPKLPTDFLEFWFKKDALANDGENILNGETHFAPILIPKMFNSNIFEGPQQFSFYNLQKIAGKRFKIYNKKKHSKIVQVIESNASYWIIARKKLLFSMCSAEEQKTNMKKLNTERGMGYEELPSLLDISTLLLINFVRQQSFNIPNVREPYSCIIRCKEVSDDKEPLEFTVNADNLIKYQENSLSILRIIVNAFTSLPFKNIACAAVKKF